MRCRYYLLSSKSQLCWTFVQIKKERAPAKFPQEYCCTFLSFIEEEAWRRGLTECLQVILCSIKNIRYTNPQSNIAITSPPPIRSLIHTPVMRLRHPARCTTKPSELTGEGPFEPRKHNLVIMVYMKSGMTGKAEVAGKVPRRGA